ncbi:SHS2 domain-containing protein [Geothermobacter ehrlichii]|uniref:SHS2 domain-containing protein n=1 Tax=Geothermobacter ehrlichii TaxID=213224 RepID=A0A5D3WLM6_9BACT|nr:archease [Geothermobacter ehrlichii]TYO99337.1 SHS2 domain-containing protein [Geothermobacter ehrlichii]
MRTHHLLEHTADMGIEAEGESLAELFVETGRGLRQMITGETVGSVSEEITVEITGGDREELLVNWLNEILYLFEIRGFFPAEFAIDEMDETHLRVRVGGERFDPARHPVEREVKAATYHQLVVEERDGTWRARVYVDL